MLKINNFDFQLAHAMKTIKCGLNCSKASIDCIDEYNLEERNKNTIILLLNNSGQFN
jgi:hypothetical protein